MLQKISRLAIAGILAASLMGCATIQVKGDKKIFLHATEGELADAKFFVDGKPVTWAFQPYSYKETSRTSNYVTTTVTSLPAISLEQSNPYYTLTIESATHGKKDVLL